MLRRLGHRSFGILSPVDHPGILVEIALFLVLARRYNSLGRLCFSGIIRNLMEALVLLEVGDLVHQLLLPLVERFLDGENIIFHRVVIPLLEHGEGCNSTNSDPGEKRQGSSKFTHCSHPPRPERSSP